MKRTPAELLETVKKFIGDRTDDEALNLIEDVKDSYATETDGEDWKKKYEDNDKAWREKYKARFFEATEEKPKDKTELDNGGEEEVTLTDTTLSDLFEGGKING